ncbi:MAG: hypothetical protein D6679_00045 [Candidatus Hydrogenedentota bacterium]|nr:MAG: hypothetical protein D6679_00045 [Candidatus Hydrogenedentota bacterium]
MEEEGNYGRHGRHGKKKGKSQKGKVKRWSAGILPAKERRGIPKEFGKETKNGGRRTVNERITEATE